MQGPNLFCTDGIARQTAPERNYLGKKECLYAFEFANICINLSKDDSLEFSNVKAELYLEEVFVLSC